MILLLKVLLAIHIEIGVGIKNNLSFSITHEKNCWNPLAEKWASMVRKKKERKMLSGIYTLVLILDFLNTQYNF